LHPYIGICDVDEWTRTHNIRRTPNSWRRIGAVFQKKIALFAHQIRPKAAEIRNGHSLFVYPRLERAGQIRLIRIPRKGFLAIPNYELSVVSLGDAIDYEAISYTWGDPTDKRIIRMNNEAYETTASAEEILRGYSSFWRSRLVWIDAICINQDDNPEKSSQVAMMRRIYQHATRVLVWLGDAKDAEFAIDFMEDFALGVGQYEPEKPQISHSRNRLRRNRYRKVECFHQS
jgi:hypothetical protein